MKSEGLAFYTEIYPALIALMLFVSTFFFILLFHMRSVSKEKENQLAQIPFAGDHNGPI